MSQSTDKVSILVVEDEVIIADSLCMTLEKYGYEVLDPVLSYSQAVETLQKRSVNLVLLDVNLSSKQNGIDLANWINDHVGIPFVFLTSNSDRRTLEEAKTTNPYGFLVKPYHEATVHTTIELALDSFRKKETEPSSEVDLSIFTSAERVVLSLINQNMTTKKISEHLSVSPSTVKNHRHNICSKLGLGPNTHSLVSWVQQNKSLLN